MSHINNIRIIRYIRLRNNFRNGQKRKINKMAHKKCIYVDIYIYREIIKYIW